MKRRFVGSLAFLVSDPASQSHSVSLALPMSYWRYLVSAAPLAWTLRPATSWLDEFACDSAHKAGDDFRASEGGFEAKIMLLYENSE